MNRQYGVMSVALLLSVLGIGGASAGTIASTTLYMSQFYSGNPPPDAVQGAPYSSWATATLSSGTLTGGVYKYTLDLQSYLTSDEFVGTNAGSGNQQIGWAFNLSSDLAGTSFSCSGSGQVCNSNEFTTKFNIGKVGGGVPGSYNLAFYWNKWTFTKGSYANLSFTSTNGDLHFANADSGNSSANLNSAVHIQGYNGCSGWVVNSNANDGSGTNKGTCGYAVPEPSELPMMAFGLAFMFGGLFWIRRRKV